jgi:hypothetical protein
VVRARGHLARREFASARRLLEETIGRHPTAVGPHVFLSYVLLQESQDYGAAERTLRRVLELDPNNVEARRNLEVLLRQEKRGHRAFPSDAPSLVSRRDAEKHDVPSFRVAFACFSPFPFCVDSAYEMPLGGSESAVCYLTEALAQQGHEVFLLNATPTPVVSRGGHCLPPADDSIRQLLPLDALVVVTLAGKGQALRALVSPETALVLWIHLPHDQPAVQALDDPAETPASRARGTPMTYMAITPAIVCKPREK